VNSILPKTCEHIASVADTKTC